MLNRIGKMDSETRTLTAECTCTELVYLSGLLGGASPLGLENTFRGAELDSVDDALHIVRTSLIARQYLVALPNGPTEIDPVLAVLIRVAIFPSVVLLLRGSTASGGVESQAFYLRGPLIVEVVAVSASTYRLQMLGGNDSIVQRISESWHLTSQQAAPGVAGLVPEAVLQAARQLVVEQGPSRAADALTQAGLEEATSCSLAETLADPHRNAAVVALRPGEMNWQVAGFGMLDGGNGLWRLRTTERGGKPWAEVIPTDAATLVSELSRLLAHFTQTEPETAAT